MNKEKQIVILKSDEEPLIKPKVKVSVEAYTYKRVDFKGADSNQKPQPPFTLDQLHF